MAPLSSNLDRIFRSQTQRVEKYDLDDYISFSRLRASQNPREEPFAHFAETISKADELVEYLNEMMYEGFSYDPILERETMVGNSLIELPEHRIETEREIARFRSTFETLIDTADNLKKLFLLNFKGTTLSRLTRDNLLDYLRSVSTSIQVNRLELPGPGAGFSGTSDKIRYLNEVWERNQAMLSQSLFIGPPKCLLQPRKIYFTHIPADKTHKYLVYFYKELFGHRLECNKIVFCDESTSWKNLKRTRSVAAN